MFGAKAYLKVCDYYLGKADPKNPLISPLHADLHGLPPLLVHVGRAKRCATMPPSSPYTPRRRASRWSCGYRRWCRTRGSFSPASSRRTPVAAAGRAVFAPCRARRGRQGGHHRQRLPRLCMGIQLQRQGVTSFCILEKDGDIGGTWRNNTFTGLRVRRSSPALLVPF